MARWKPWPCITLPRECFVFEINFKFLPMEFLGFSENRRKTFPAVQIALWGVFSEIPTSYRLFFCRSHLWAPLHRVSKAVFNFKCREQSLKVVHDIIFAIKRQNSSEQLLKANIFVLFRSSGTFSIQMLSCFVHDKKAYFHSFSLNAFFSTGEWILCSRTRQKVEENIFSLQTL